MDRLLIYDRNKELIHVILGIKNGWCHEFEKKRGITHLLEHAIFLGNKTYPSPDDETQKKGVFLNGTTLPYETLFFFTSYKDDLEEILTLLISLIFNPEFDIDKINKEKEESIITAVIDESQYTPWELAFEWAKNLVFDRDFKLSLGTIEDLNEIKINDLIDWHKKFYHFNNSFLMIYGDFSLDVIENILRNRDIRFGYEYPILNKVIWNKKEVNIRKKKMKNSEVVYGFKLKEYDIRWKIISILLGNYPISKLWDENFRKFIYTCESQLEFTPENGGLFINFGLNSNKNLDLIHKNFLSLIKNFYITDKELEYAKKLTLMEILKMKEGGESGFLKFLSINRFFKYENFHSIINDINSIKKDELINLINKNLKEENMVRVVVSS